MNCIRIWSLSLLTTPQQTSSIHPIMCTAQAMQGPWKRNIPKTPSLHYTHHSKQARSSKKYTMNSISPPPANMDLLLSGKFKPHTMKSADNPVYFHSTASLPGVMIFTRS